MDYHELRLKGLPQPLIGHHCRGFFAEKGDGVLPEALFHYKDGQVLNHLPPPIRFLGKPNGDVVIYGLGEVGAELLYANARRLAETVLRGFPDWLPRFEMKTGRFKVEWKPYAVPYRVASWVVNVPSRESVDDLEAVKALLLAGVRREFEDLEIDQSVSEDQIGAVVRQRSVGVRVKGGQYLPALDVSFTMPFLLTGPWQIGRLKARGYGRLSRLPATPTPEAS